ncbi:YceI family protein [Erwinia sp. INIA01]|uniref:YceI family protein n=1 Tax=Erwinia sp. INIA01 TaxID=2991500 RepID=UPI00325FC69B
MFPHTRLQAVVHRILVIEFPNNSLKRAFVRPVCFEENYGMTRIATLLAFGLFSSPMLHATPLTYQVATDRTDIALSWNAFGDTFSQARLSGVTGEVLLDPGHDYNDRINVKIPVSTLKASNDMLTWQLKSQLFFDAVRYRDIIFTSTRVVDKGQGQYKIFGLLQVKNVQRPVILEATMAGKEASSSPDELVLFATTTISRSAFKMDRLAILVDDRIKIDIAIRAHLAPDENASSP